MSKTQNNNLNKKLYSYFFLYVKLLRYKPIEKYLFIHFFIIRNYKQELVFNDDYFFFLPIV